jgi:hypothetical protein
LERLWCRETEHRLNARYSCLPGRCIGRGFRDVWKVGVIVQVFVRQKSDSAIFILVIIGTLFFLRGSVGLIKILEPFLHALYFMLGFVQ